MTKLKHSITLYGFGFHYMRGEYSLEDVLKKTKMCYDVVYGYRGRCFFKT